jgi:hypothetical protein
MPSVALSSTAARLLELQIQNGLSDLNEFIEGTPFANLFDIGRLSLTNPKEPHSYGRDAMSFQAESQHITP